MQYWSCKCDCGTIKAVRRTFLINGKTKSCGCISRTHGLSNGRTYRIWTAMKTRCNNPNAINYAHYGGRGIGYSEKLSTFEGFLKVLGECPEGLTLERIDNERNYEEGNVKWATMEEQRLNRRNTVILIFRGQSKPLRVWAKELNIPAKRISARLAIGWSVNEALTLPKLTHRKS